MIALASTSDFHPCPAPHTSLGSLWVGWFPHSFPLSAPPQAGPFSTSSMIPPPHGWLYIAL